MRVGQRESREKTGSYFTKLAEETVVLDPIMSVVMRLFAPPSVADQRIVKTSPAAAQDLFSTSSPVESWLAIIRRKWDNLNRISGGSLIERILLGCALSREPFSFLLISATEG